MTNLNLGCGHDILPGWCNVDVRPRPGVDLVRDLDRPYCLYGIPTASVQRVRALALLEHLWHWEALMLEIARVLEPGGALDVLVPFGDSPVPWHVRTFGTYTFDPFRSDFRPRHIDLRRRQPTYSTCEFDGIQYFTLHRRVKEHYYPFSWHLAQRFGRRAYAVPLGRVHSLYFEFRRNGRAYE